MINKKIEWLGNNKRHFSLLFFLSFILNIQSNFAQAGIYDETDIEFQSMFIEAQLEKVKGNTEEQISLLKNVLKRDKSSHAAYFELAKTYTQLEDFDAAEKNAKKAIQFDGSNPFYLNLLADVYERSEQFQNANDIYKKLILLDANNFEYHDKMAFNQMVIGNPKDAITTLENWQNQKGISGTVSQKIFDIHNGLGDTKKALEVLTNLSNEFPSNTNYLVKKARYLLFVGEKKEALNTYNKVLEIDPQNQTAILAKTKSNINQSSGNTNLKELVTFVENENISLDVKIKELMPYMSKMPLTKEDNETLKSISQSLISAYPNEAKSFAVRGDILFYAGEFSESEKAYDQAIKLDDRKFLVWDQWILNLWELENYAKMEKTALDAIDFFPNEVNAYLYYVIALDKNKKDGEAADMLEEATFISGDNPKFKPLLNIIYNWTNIDKFTSEQILRSISSINDDQINSAIHFELLGDIYNHISENSKSKMYWEKAIQFGASEARINKKIGVN